MLYAVQCNFNLKYTTHFGEEIYLEIVNPGPKEFKTLQTRLNLIYKNQEEWFLSTSICFLPYNEELLYRYVVVKTNKELIFSGEMNVPIQNIVQAIPNNQAIKTLNISDTWLNPADISLYFNQPSFTNILFKQNAEKLQLNSAHNCLFLVKYPFLKPQQNLYITGNISALGNWQAEDNKNLKLNYHKSLDCYFIHLSIKKKEFEYKYYVLEKKENSLINFEQGSNRKAVLSTLNFNVFQDGYFKYKKLFKGTGIAVPVFSLKSQNSGGIGEFTDLKLLADWGKKLNVELIQILPINDTSNTFTWLDSYPYSSISTTALHPIYLNVRLLLLKYAPKELDYYTKISQDLNNLEKIDYEKVIKVKWQYINLICQNNIAEIVKDTIFLQFCSTNVKWLKPYSYFCFYRDKYKTADWQSWSQKSISNHLIDDSIWLAEIQQNKEIAKHCLVQFWLAEQLSEVTKYLNEKGILLKGDLPIGVNINSVDVWQNPNLFNLTKQAGAPPDDFSELGQNWGFPTYNWPAMKKDNYLWWQERFSVMQKYFNVFRIDHILGFFRIWSIPNNQIDGIMGIFEPAIPITNKDLQYLNIELPYERLTEPFITKDIVEEIFNSESHWIIHTFLDQLSLNNVQYKFKSEMNSQKLIQSFFDNLPDNFLKNKKDILRKLLYLYSNRILLKTKDNNEFHFRFFMDKTHSFKRLSYNEQMKIKDLYNYYFFTLQESLWDKEGREKLPSLKKVTNMLICGEDLGLVPKCVPKLMQELNILSLEVQRMPCRDGLLFNKPEQAPYFCVVSPSSHDTSTLRGWWEEEFDYKVDFYKNYLGLSEPMPPKATPALIKSILKKNLQTPAMWTILTIQDLLASFFTDLPDPEQERINIPAIANHNWNYRMNFFIENLVNDENLNKHLSNLISENRFCVNR